MKEDIMVSTEAVTMRQGGRAGMDFMLTLGEVIRPIGSIWTKELPPPASPPTPCQRTSMKPTSSSRTR
jgi:hypothetical protein